MNNRNPGGKPAPETGAITRRQFLKNAGLIAGMAAPLLMIGACKKSATQTITVTTTAAPVRFPPANGLEYLIDSDPSGIDNNGLPLTPYELLHVITPSPVVDIDGYRLTIRGLVANPLTLTYPELQQFQMVEKKSLLICPKTFADNALFGGIPLNVLLDAAGVKPEAARIVIHTLDNLQLPVPLADLSSEKAFLALTHAGRTLTREHGYPLRMIRPGQVGVFWFKCVNDIEVA